MKRMLRAFAILGLLCLNAVVSSARTLHAADTNVAVIQAADTDVDVGSDVGSWWGRRVEVLLAVMSRCPDGRRAEARINEVLAKVHSIADVRLMYIAAKNESAQPLGVTCKHGDLECAGNAQQLCAAYYGRHGHSSGTTGGDPWTRGWDFIMCQNKSPADIGTEELAERCLQEAGFTERRANLTRACWNGPEAGPILRKSAAEALRRKAYKSATIFIGGAYRCTHDDAQWYDCPGGSEVEDFVATICATYFRYTSMWPEEICGPEPPEVSPTA